MLVRDEVMGNVNARFDENVQSALHKSACPPVGPVNLPGNVMRLSELLNIGLDIGKDSFQENPIYHGNRASPSDF